MPSRFAPIGAAGVPLWTWPGFDPQLVQVAVTGRDGGVSQGRFASLNLGLHVGDGYGDVLANRRLAAGAFGAELDELVFCQQVHRRAVTVVDGSDRGRGTASGEDALPETDAVVTTSLEPVLAVLVADCVPIVLHDPVAGVLACVHAGWGGTVRGVTPHTVETMVGLGADPARIVAGIGPVVSAETYCVGEDVAALAREAFGVRAGEVLRPDGNGKHLFDLVAAARLQLTGHGVAASRIYDSGMVTGPGTPFYSHRQEGPCGRFAVLARLLRGAAR